MLLDAVAEGPLRGLGEVGEHLLEELGAVDGLRRLDAGCAGIVLAVSMIVRAVSSCW